MAIFLVMIPVLSIASGNGPGNGGNAVVCFDSSNTVKRILSIQERVCPSCESMPVKVIPREFMDRVTSVTALDLVDARRTSFFGGNFPVYEPEQGESPMEFAERVVGSFQNTRAIERIFEKGRSNVIATVNYDSGVSFAANDINPVQPFTEDDKCLITTVIKQVRTDSGNVFLHVYGPLMYPKRAGIHSVQSQGALWIHEYFLAAAKKLETTDALRRLISLVLQKVPVMKPQLSQFLSDAGLGQFDSFDPVGATGKFLDEMETLSFKSWNERQLQRSVFQGKYQEISNAYEGESYRVVREVLNETSAQIDSEFDRIIGKRKSCKLRLWAPSGELFSDERSSISVRVTCKGTVDIDPKIQGKIRSILNESNRVKGCIWIDKFYLVSQVSSDPSCPIRARLAQVSPVPKLNFESKVQELTGVSQSGFSELLNRQLSEFYWIVEQAFSDKLLTQTEYHRLNHQIAEEGRRSISVIGSEDGRWDLEIPKKSRF